MIAIKKVGSRGALEFKNMNIGKKENKQTLGNYARKN